jgi:hypothetical protein
MKVGFEVAIEEVRVTGNGVPFGERTMYAVTVYDVVDNMKMPRLGAREAYYSRSLACHMAKRKAFWLADIASDFRANYMNHWKRGGKSMNDAQAGKEAQTADEAEQGQFLGHVDDVGQENEDWLRTDEKQGPAEEQS